MSMKRTATLSRPTGFSDPAYRGSEVEILGFIWGEDQDAGGYNRSKPCALAVIAGEDRRLRSAPVDWLRIERSPENGAGK